MIDRPGFAGQLVLALAFVFAVACHAARSPQRITVSPGVTVFRDAEVLPGDMIICRASNGTAGAGVPERGGGVSNSAGITVDVDPQGVVSVSCAPSISSS